MSAWGGSVLHRLEHFAASTPDAPAYRIDEEVLTYPELRRRARAAAGGLRSMGIRAGDRVLIWLPNGLEWVIMGLAVHYAEAIVVPLNTRYTPDEMSYIAQRSGARAIVSTDSFLGRDYLAEARETVPGLEFFITAGGGSDLTVAGIEAAGDPGDPAIDEWLERIGPDDLSDIMFTSGTTGYPKGAMITHGATVGIVASATPRLRIVQADTQLVIAPFFHMFGYKYGWSYMIVVGGCTMTEAVFDAERAAHLIDRYRVAVFSGPPPIFSSLLALPDREARFDLSSIRFSLTGATIVQPSLIKDMQDVLGIDHVAQGFGLTETTACGTFTQAGDDIETIATTLGVPVDNVEVRLADDDGNEVPRGETGEIQVRGFCVMAGYYGDPVATAETIDADGWLKSGDLGTMDAAGYLRIIGRKKDLVIVGGFNVYPAEVERVLCEHPLISAAAVIGRADERMGEVPVAYIEGSAEPADVIAWCRERLANFKVPRRVVVVDELPRNAMGKVRKVDLAAAPPVS